MSRWAVLFGVPDVIECVTHHYEDDHGKHWWHCLTCDQGSNRHRDRPRGHKLASDALMGATMHARQMAANRRGQIYRQLWWHEIAETTSLSRFIDLWEIWHGPWRRHVADDDHRTDLEVMADIQAITRKINEERK